MYSLVLFSSLHDVLQFYFFLSWLPSEYVVCLFANSIYFHFYKFLMLFLLSEWSANCQAEALGSVDSLIQVKCLVLMHLKFWGGICM